MRVTVLTVCLSLASAIVPAEARGSYIRPKKLPEQVYVGFRLQENVVTLHEPVVVQFEVHNGLKEPITVTVGALVRQFFDLALTTPSGQTLHKDPFAGQVDVVTVGDGRVTVAPYGDYKESLVLNRWFPFTTQGKYSLTSRLTSEIETASGSFSAEAQTVQFQVDPRNPARLNKICENLATQVESAPNAQAAQEPAITLSYIDDSVAVPYLIRILSTNTLTYDKAIEGLARIGNRPAIEALLSLLGDNRSDVAELATIALRRVDARITDPCLKETVTKAVERSSERTRNEFIKKQIAYLDYRSPTLQQTAIQSLMKVEDGLQQAEPALQRLANDPNQPPDVRDAAKEALRKLHPNPQQ